MLTIEQVLKRLKKEPNLMAVSKATGISYASVWTYANGKIRKPGARHIDALRRRYQKA